MNNKVYESIGELSPLEFEDTGKIKLQRNSDQFPISSIVNLIFKTLKLSLINQKILRYKLLPTKSLDSEYYYQSYLNDF